MKLSENIMLYYNINTRVSTVELNDYVLDRNVGM